MNSEKINELKAKISKAKTNPSIPENMRKQLVDMYEKQLAEVEGSSKKAEPKKETAPKAEKKAVKAPAKKSAPKATSKAEETKIKKHVAKVKKYTSHADFKSFIKKLIGTGKYDFLKGMSPSAIADDKRRTAKPIGARFKGEDYRKPSKSDIKADAGKPASKKKVYYESRTNRSDRSAKTGL